MWKVGVQEPGVKLPGFGFSLRQAGRKEASEVPPPRSPCELLFPAARKAFDIKRLSFPGALHPHPPALSQPQPLWISLGGGLAQFLSLLGWQGDQGCWAGLGS